MYPSALIAGRYRLIRLIGAGSMGQVWQARDERLQRAVAVKCIDLSAATGPVTRQRFEREAIGAARLNHPNIVTTFDGGVDGDVAYLVMELLRGDSLARRLAGGALAAPEASRIAADVADALDATHAIGVVHRDVKPGNVMLTPSGVKVLDFGIARLTDESVAETGELVGTAAYLPPERATGGAGGPASDVYALGCLLFAMLTGRPPFAGASTVEVARQQVNVAPPRVRQLRPDTPAPLDALVAAMLAKAPEDRPAMGEVAARLRGLAGPAAADDSGSGARSNATGGLAGPGTTPLPPAGVTALLPDGSGVGPSGTAVLGAGATALLPDGDPGGAPPRVAAANPVGADDPPRPDAPEPAPPWFRRGVRWVTWGIVGLSALALVGFGANRVLAPLTAPKASASRTSSPAPTPRATATRTPTPTRGPSITWPTLPALPLPTLPSVGLPTLPSVALPTLPGMSDMALRAAVAGVGAVLDAWSPADAGQTRAKAALQTDWAAASARILAGRNAAGALAGFSEEVARYRADGDLPAGIATGLSLALRSVGAVL